MVAASAVAATATRAAKVIKPVHKKAKGGPTAVTFRPGGTGARLREALARLSMPSAFSLAPADTAVWDLEAALKKHTREESE